MQKLTLEFLVSLFSAPRLRSYASNEDISSDSIIENYHFNIKLSESLLPSLHYFEVLLRNKIDHIFQEYYGKNWLLNIPNALQISTQDLQKIHAVIHKISRQKNNYYSNDDIVAQMSFGFWCAFFHKKYDPIIWHRKNAIISVFPHLSKNCRTRSYIEQKIIKIKNLRNRIAHLEPIWHDSSNIYDMHQNILGLIAAMSPLAASLLQDVDRFATIYKNAQQYEPLDS